jgi:hypothetical protein
MDNVERFAGKVSERGSNVIHVFLFLTEISERQGGVFMPYPPEVPPPDLEPPPKPPLEPPDDELPPDLEPLELEPPLLPPDFVLELEPELLEEPELDLLEELEPEPLLDELLLLALLLLSVLDVELLPAEPVVLLPAFGLLLLVDELAGAVLVLLPALFAATAPAAPAAAPAPATAAAVEFPLLLLEEPLPEVLEPVLFLVPVTVFPYFWVVTTLPFCTPVFARAAR